MAVRFKGDTTVIFGIAAIGFFAIAVAQVALLAWRLVDGWFGPF